MPVISKDKMRSLHYGLSFYKKVNIFSNKQEF